MTTQRELTIHLRSSEGHNAQTTLRDSEFKRIIIKAGRRGGKTVGVAIRAVKRFLKGRRQLYAAPTSEQTDAFWYEVKRALQEPIGAGVFKCNETEKFIEVPNTKQRIKAKTAWSPDTLRGDYADDLYLDEFQLMVEDTWDQVGAPMLADNDGDAVLIFTPPSLMTTGVSRARDPRHASKLFQKALTDPTWQTLHFTSFDNPFISHDALRRLTNDMSLDSYRREIMAEDDEIETSWLVYGMFNEKVCKIKRFPIPPNWLIYSGHDFGTANPAALFVAQDTGTGQFYVYKEYLPGARSPSQHAEAFKELTKGYIVVKRVGGNQNTEEENRLLYGAHGWPITAPVTKEKKTQIEKTRIMLERNRIFIFDDCYALLTEIANCLWKLDENNKPTDIINNEAQWHLLACLRYLMSDFTPETVSSGYGKMQATRAR